MEVTPAQRSLPATFPAKSGCLALRHREVVRLPEASAPAGPRNPEVDLPGHSRIGLAVLDPGHPRRAAAVRRFGPDLALAAPPDPGPAAAVAAAVVGRRHRPVAVVVAVVAAVVGVAARPTPNYTWRRRHRDSNVGLLCRRQPPLP